jgi:glycosyltransferase involved in cell wall biosynthesis
MPNKSGDGVRTGGGQRIAIAAPTGWELINRDLPFILALVEKGHQVLCLAPSLTEIEWHTILANGAAVEQIDLVADRWALMPKNQVAARIAKILKAWGADTVMARGEDVMPAVINGARKAKVARIIPVVDWMIGETDAMRADGDAEDEDDIAEEPGHIRRAFDSASVCLCYNHDHAAQVEYSGLLHEDARTFVLPGTGVDVDAFAFAPMPKIDRGLTFLMIGDMRRSSGVVDFCKAARIVQSHAPNAEFIVAGRASDEEDAVPLRTMAEFRGVVEYAGEATDPSELISRCHVFVAPSHGCGLAYDALPAMAMGRPLIVGDSPGCRELVDERVNGCMAEPGDPQSLAKAMESYFKRPELMASMARASRLKAERRFDRRLAVAALVELVGLDQTLARRSRRSGR